MTQQPSWAATGFAAGTFVQTTKGLRPIERLVPGVDLLEFRDETTGPILHLHTAHFTTEMLAAMPDAQPVHVPALALGNIVPARPLLVSANAHVLATGRLVERVADMTEVLIPMSALVGSSGIERVIPKDGITYYHILSDTHHTFRVEGLMCDTLYLGKGTSSDLSDALRKVAPDAAHPEAPYLPIMDAETAGKITEKILTKNRPLVADDSE